MANIGNIQTTKGQIFTTAHVLSQSRASSSFFVMDGCDVHQSATPGMSVVVDSGHVCVGFGMIAKAIISNTLTISVANPTYPRIDVIYIDPNGTPTVYAGTPAAISPSSKTDFREMANPAPGGNIPAGVILALVYVPAGATSIVNSNINDIATYGSYVPDIPLTSSTPGKVPYWTGGKALSEGYTVGTGASNLLQLDSYARIPAISGELLTKTATTNVLTTSGDTLVRSGSSLTRVAKGTTGQAYIQGADVPVWTTRKFSINYSFGDGANPISNSNTLTVQVPIASKIVAMTARSYDSANTLVTVSSASLELYIHDGNADRGTAVQTFTMSSTNYISQSSLSYTVATDKYVSITLGSTDAKAISLNLTLEAT